MATLLGVLLKHFILNPQGGGILSIYFDKKTKVNFFVGNLTRKTLMIYVFNKIFYLPVAVGLAKNKLFENIFFYQLLETVTLDILSWVSINF